MGHPNVSGTGAPAAPVLDLDPFSDETLENPYPFHQTLRAAGPVAYIPKYNMYAVGQYDALQAILNNYPHFTSTGGIGLTDIRKPDAWRAASPIAEVDPPHHSDVRGALTRILPPTLIRSWESKFQTEALKMVRDLSQGSEIDAVPDLIQAFVLKVFLAELGVDLPKEHFLALGEMNFNQMGPMNDILEQSLKKVEHILPLFENAYTREAMLPGGFCEKIFQAEDNGEFAPGTAGTQVRSFLRAGVDTTIAGIGHTLRLLAENPDQWAKLKADPTKAQATFDEGIRLESPVQVIFRTTLDPVEFQGLALAGDTKVGLFLGAANRDPDKFPEPDRFDIDRGSAGTHVALGGGPHICIGQMIARAEAGAVIGALVKTVDAITLAGFPEYRLNNTLRTLKTLPLHLTKA